MKTQKKIFSESGKYYLIEKYVKLNRAKNTTKWFVLKEVAKQRIRFGPFGIFSRKISCDIEIGMYSKEKFGRNMLKEMDERKDVHSKVNRRDEK